MTYKKILLLITTAIFACSGAIFAQAAEDSDKLNVSVTNNSKYDVKIVIRSMFHPEQPEPRLTEFLVHANKTVEVQLLHFYNPSASFATPEENLEFFGDSIDLSTSRKVVPIDVLEDNIPISELKVVGKLMGDTYTVNIHPKRIQHYCE